MSKAVNIKTDPMMNNAKASLKRLGFEDFIGSQADCVLPLMNGKDVLALLPTGSGKSAIYQTVSLARDGVGLVVSPLIAIMQQQVLELKGLGIKAEFLNSTLDGAEQNDLHWRLRHGDIEILYISPEKLFQTSLLGLLEDVSFSCIAIDEAHCVLRWGNQFRPEYAQLGRLKQLFPNTPLIALTGTLLPANQSQIIDSLQLQNAEVVRESVDRPNIKIQISQKRRAKHQLLSFIMKEGVAQAGIVYCRSRLKTEQLKTWLLEQGIESDCYHAHMSATERTLAHDRFARGQVQVMVATTAYGMGVDLEHVRFVVHMDLPLNLESYVQEIGRAGRNAKTATALMFYGLQDVLSTWEFARNENAEPSFWELMQFLEQSGCRRNALLQFFGETKEQDCQNCDRCLGKGKQHNASTAAQKLLSLIHFTKGNVPYATLIQTLLGKQTKNVVLYKLEQHPLFGKGKSLTEIDWKTLVRKLLAEGYLLQQSAHPFYVCLAEKCRPLLRSDEHLVLSSDWFYLPLNQQATEVHVDSTWSRFISWGIENQVSKHLSDTQLHRICEANPNSLAALSRVSGLSKDQLLTLNAHRLFDGEHGLTKSFADV